MARTYRTAIRLLMGLVLGSALAMPALAKTVSVSATDNGKTVALAVGDTLEIVLPGQHGSGRYWRIDADLTPELVLAGRTTASVAEAGAPETTTFTFAAGAPGTVTFRATYAEPGTPRAESSQIAFEVEVGAP